MGYFKLNGRSIDGSESKLCCITKRGQDTRSRPLKKTFENLVRGAHQHITKPTIRNSETMGSKGRDCDWGYL